MARSCPIRGSCAQRAWGNVRTKGTGLPTDVGFTSQRADSTGLMYYRARYYAGYLNRWLSPDTIIPQPGNPQSLNRFSYVRNNPLKYTDPTGHREMCDDAPCPTTANARPNSYGIRFTADAGVAWVEHDLNEVLNAAGTIARSLTAVLRHENWIANHLEGVPLLRYVPTEVFRQVFGIVTFNRNAGNCGNCWAWAANPWGTVQVYVQNVAHGNYTAQNAAHELGHTFDWRTGFQARADLRQKWNDDPAFPRRDPANVDLRGYAGTRFGWQQSHSAEASEEYADMFLGWAYNRWETDVNGAFTPDGAARSNWTSSNMAQWIALAIDQQ